MRALWVWLTCWDLCPVFFRHKEIVVVQEFDRNTRKLRCNRCGKYFAMSDTHRAVLPWDDEIEDLYANWLGYGRTIR